MPKLSADSADQQRAIDLYAAGDRPGAGRIAREILRRNPTHAGAAWLLGALALDEGRTEEAMLFFQHAAAREPDDARFHNGLGEAYRALGRWPDAIACFEAAVRIDPSLAAAHHALGLTRLETGETAQAIEDFGQAVSLRSDHARSHLNLGRAWQLHGDLPAAIRCYQEAIRLDPNYAIAHNNLGAALQVEGRSQEAAVHLRRALALKPDYPEAHYNLGNALQGLYEPSAAWESYREALRLRPGYVNAQYQLGLVLEQLGRREEAVQVYEQLLAQNPGHAEGWQRLGVMHMLRRMWDQARAAFERQAACSPAKEKLSADLAYVRQMLCDWSTLAADSEQLWTQAAARIAAGQTAGIPPFFSIVLSWPADRQLAVARAEAQSLTARHEKLRDELQIRHQPRAAGDRLRIGYLSGDFYDHAVSHLAQGLFGLHDRRQFEIFTYSYGPDDASSYRRRIQADSEHFVDAASLTVKDLAQRIAADGISILVDMMGYSGHSRLEVMSLRPAPIQASWLSYPGSTGAEFIDYLVGDRIVTAPERAADFSEK
ncbi:MAG TPA: tetratricopeptide repeat protein, partial [Planctomycetaceae bacterium]